MLLVDVATQVIPVSLDKGDIQVTINVVLGYKVLRAATRMELKVDTMWRSFCELYPHRADHADEDAATVAVRGERAC